MRQDRGMDEALGELCQTARTNSQFVCGGIRTDRRPLSMQTIVLMTAALSGL